MTVIEIIRLVAPEFESVSDVELEEWIEFAKPFVSKKQFGKLYNHAIAYLICHKMKSAGLGVDDGMGSYSDAVRFSSYSEGSRSVSFNGVGASDDELRLTPYGMQYLNLRKSVIVPITISNVEDSAVQFWGGF